MDEGDISMGEQVEPGEDAAVALEEAKHDLDLMALFVKPPIGSAPA